MLQLLLPPEHAARLLLEAFLRVQGGKGSGNFGHEGRPGEIGGSAAELTNVKTTFPKRFHVRIESDQGFITLLRTDDFEGPMGQQVLVGDIEVKPQYRKQGFALALYESALEYAVSVGAKNVTSTGALSQDAKDLWKRFEKYGRAGVNEEGDRVFLPLKTLGGPGSGYFGHAGRPGQVGGSSDSGGVAIGLESDPYEHYPNAPDTRKLKFDADAIGEQLLEDGALDEEGFLSLYHVTGSDPDQILKEGLIPGKKPAPGQDWEADHAKYATYFFRSKEHALDQAEQAGEGFSVIRAQLPVTEQVLRRLVPDEDTGLTPMQGVQALLAGENVGVIGGVPAYALQPVSTSKRKARGLGGPGSGYFGHAGRPGEVGGSKGDSWTQKDIQEDRVLNGVPLRRIDNPDFSKGVNHTIKEDPLYIPERKTASAGVIVVEPDGRVWIVSPKNYYGGYRNTFSKGTVDSGEYLQEAALRELWEETGLVAKVTAPLIDVQRSTSVARYYIGKRVDGAPWAAGKETHRVKLVSLDDPKLDNDLRNVWGKETADHDVLDALREHFGKLKAAGGQGSGDFGHAGRPGQIGGSAPDEGGSGSIATAPNEQFKPSDWPIHDDVIRDKGTFYPGEMQSQGNQWTDGLTDLQRSSIESYTDEWHEPVNRALRQGPTNHPELAVSQPISKDIAEALESSPTPPPPELVWRGFGGVYGAAYNPESEKKEKELSLLKKGDVIRLDGFQSTTINPEFAQEWGSLLMEIAPKKGGYVKPVSAHPQEDEYLLPHGREYRVRAWTDVKIMTASGSVKKRVLQLEML